MIKKITALLLALLVAVTFAACASTDEPADGNDGNNAPADNIVTDEVEAPVDDGETAPEADGENVNQEVPDITLQQIRDSNYLGDLMYANQTIRVVDTVLSSDLVATNTNTYEFSYNQEGYPIMQGLYKSEETGDAETYYYATDGLAASFDVYVGFSKSVTLFPTNQYTMNLENNWDWFLPNVDYEEIVDISLQDGATIVETLDYDEEYGQNYLRTLYYLDENMHIVYKETTYYLVTEGATVSKDIPYGMDTAPIVSVDRITFEYGTELSLDLSTKETLMTGDVCEVTVHIVNGEETETQVLNVAKDAMLMVMSAAPDNQESDVVVYNFYADEGLTEFIDLVDLSGTTAEVWAVPAWSPDTVG